MKSRIGSRAWLMWSGALFVMGAALIGCGGDGTTSEFEPDEVGSLDIELNMNLAGDVVVDSVNWSITHPSNGYSESGVVDTSTNLALFHLEVGRIPESLVEEYTLTLDAEGYDPVAPGTIVADCATTAAFNVAAGTVEAVSVIPLCVFRLEATGSVEITGNSADFCPEIEQVVVAQVWNGTGFDVSVTATDDDGDPIDFAWTTSNGDFVDPAAASTVHRCASAGVAETITVTVSPTAANGCADDAETILVDCAGAYTGP